MRSKKIYKTPSLRTFITVAISVIVTGILICALMFFYIRTSSILKSHSEESITRQLNQVNQLITEQIHSIDSIIPLFLSNTIILSALESPPSSEANIDSKHAIEKQMSYIYYSTSLASKNFTDSIYITCNDDTIFSTYTSVNSPSILAKGEKITKGIDSSQTKLMCKTLPSDSDNLYFARNIFSSYSGKRIGTFVVAINLDKWMDYCVQGLDPSWFISLYDSEMQVFSNPDIETQGLEVLKHITPESFTISFQELKLDDEFYFVAAQELTKVGITSAVAAPKDLLLKDLNSALAPYVILLAVTLFFALLTAIIIGQAITRPIDRMVYHIDQISIGAPACLPPMKMYHEFDVWAESFNKMLRQLDIYYNDNFQKQLLLKNAEIQSLQSQINPHFMFNVLNTIAWKAQMSDNEEIYQMVISLGELLKMNTLSKEHSFITLAREMEYVKFYIYLQQMRFEDKISCSIHIPDSLKTCLIPCFCIQPLVENAIVHGLEPKKGKGKLTIQIFKVSEDIMEINIVDNGIGFSVIPDIQDITPSVDDSHTHIGLRNLDKRLALLFDGEARLRIDSTPNICTSVSFRIPIREEESL